MLKLFKKKRSKDLKSQSENSLWSYNPSVYDEELPGYSQGPSLFLPSAPEEEPTVSKSDFTERVYDVEGEFEIRTKLQITSVAGIIGILEELLDKYQGSVAYRPLLMSNILLMAFHVGRKGVDNNINTYNCEICYPISYQLSSRYPKLRERIDYSLSTRFKRGKADIFLNIKCKMTPTNKRGVSYFDVYRSPMANGADPPNFDEVGGIFGINVIHELSEIVFN
ncbi:matrix [Mosqueiro virus]|uniref:Matrix protein n=1 Tax=Mosqueiro virus TaxID=200403 RepID=A0A0D3R1B7_9RHAB|nr:matrix [Mosqueiro virus]AJR28519.1 matrix [Mosqueiro virus]